MSLTLREFTFGIRGIEVQLSEADRAREDFPHLTITDPMMQFLLDDMQLELSDTLDMIATTDNFGVEGFNGFRMGVVAGKIIAGTASPKVNESGILPFEFVTNEINGSKRGFINGLAHTACLGVEVDLELLYNVPDDEQICAYHDDTFLVLLAKKMQEQPISSLHADSHTREIFTPFEEPLE